MKKKKEILSKQKGNGVKRNVSVNEAIPKIENKKDGEVTSFKCPECFEMTDAEELETFGGMCEECSGAFEV